MAGDPLAFAVFTLVPLVVLSLGALLTIAYVFVLEDRRILLSTILFVLMLGHQFTEVWQFATGPDPYQNLLGEGIETLVNLLAVGAIGYVIWTLQAERRLRERLALVHGRVVGEDIDEERAPLGMGDERGSVAGPFGPGWFRVPVFGRLLAFLYTSLPLGNTADLESVLRVAIQNARITFPIATFEVETLPPVTVLAEPTYLQEILETVLEQLVVYNDSSDPTVVIDVETGRGAARIVFRDNGSGLPEDVVGRLTGRHRPVDGVEPTDELELVYVHAFIEKWAGSVDVRDGAVQITLPTPGATGGGETA